MSKITAILALLLLPLSFTSCDQTVRPTHNKCLILDMSGSMIHQYKAAELTKGILGHDFETGGLYEDGISLVVTTIGDNSNARKIKLALPPTEGYWSVDEGLRKKEMETFYTDVLTAISRILASEDKRPMSYINRSIASVADHFDEQGGEMYVLSDMSQENVFSQSFPKMFNKYGFKFLDHYDTMAASLTKDAPYEMNNVNVHVVFMAPSEMDEYFRLCSKFWKRFLTDKGAKNVEFTASINSSY